MQTIERKLERVRRGLKEQSVAEEYKIVLSDWARNSRKLSKYGRPEISSGKSFARADFGDYTMVLRHDDSGSGGLSAELWSGDPDGGGQLLSQELSPDEVTASDPFGGWSSSEVIDILDSLARTV